MRLQQIEFKKNVEDKQSVCTFSLERERGNKGCGNCVEKLLCVQNTCYPCSQLEKKTLMNTT